MRSLRATRMYVDEICMAKIGVLTLLQLMEKHLPELDPEVAEIMVSQSYWKSQIHN